MSELKAILTVGPSGSGKTTWSQTPPFTDKSKWGVFERDQYRAVLQYEYLHPEKDEIPSDLVRPIWADYDWEWEAEVTGRIQKDIREMAHLGINVILPDTNLNIQKRVETVAFLEEVGYAVEFQVFDGEYADLALRDRARSSPVGCSLIAKQLDQLYSDPVYRASKRLGINTVRSDQIVFEDWADDTGRQDPNKQPAIIVDIDGTVARMTDRTYKDFDKVHLDQPIWPVINIINVISQRTPEVEVLFCTGRVDSPGCMQATSDWLKKYIPGNFHVFYRAEGDFRPDFEIKEEVYDRYIRGRYNAWLVIEDRPSVARMWRRRGLFVLQCGNPHIEF